MYVSRGEPMLGWCRSCATGIGPLFVRGPLSPLFRSPYRATAPSPSGGWLLQTWWRRRLSSLPSFARLLQPYFCGTQGHRRIASGDRPLPPQRLGGRLPLPHGDYPNRSPVSQGGDWMVSLDLQDAYLQVPVHPSSHRYLRFCVGESVYQFRALCFGLLTAPRAFTRVMAPVSLIMHRHGFRILWYLDDWLALASTFQEIVRARVFLLWLCRRLVFMSTFQRALWIRVRLGIISG